MATIKTSVESARQCGYRKKGGIYLVTDGIGKTCLKLPIALNVCPCCGAGIKFSRGFTWITASLFISAKCGADDLPFGAHEHCFDCPLNITDPAKKFGLLWVGDSFYSANEFTREASTRGISKRIATVPHGFEVGKTWVLLAHIKGWSSVILNEQTNLWETKYAPGIFHVFKPSRIEYVVKGTETDDELDALEKRGFMLINVIRDIDAQTALEFLT